MTVVTGIIAVPTANRWRTGRGVMVGIILTTLFTCRTAASIRLAFFHCLFLLYFFSKTLLFKHLFKQGCGLKRNVS